jgi:pimeloyl-ACP methyl ester carboxylesterase
MIDEPRFEGSIRLRDGRRLGFAEFGPVSGRPLVWLHGTPGGRRQIAPDARALAWKHGIRIIGVERPGIGESTPHAYAAIVDFAADLAELCDALEIDRFAVAGLSGGGPYTLACAHEMPDRVVLAIVLGGVAPSVGDDAVRGGANDMVRMMSPLVAAAWRPLGRAMHGLVRVLIPAADTAMDLFASTMPPGDKVVFSDPPTRSMFKDDLIRASRRNMHALWLDSVLFGRDWGFPLRDVRVPTFLRYGDADIIVPLEHGRHLASRLPRAELRVYPGEGHVGALGASQEIFDVLLDHWSRV